MSRPSTPPTYVGARGQFNGCPYEVMDEVACWQKKSDPEKALYILQLHLGTNGHTEYLFGYRFCTEPVERPEPNVSTLERQHLIIPPEEPKLLIGMALCKNWF